MKRNGIAAFFVIIFSLSILTHNGAYAQCDSLIMNVSQSGSIHVSNSQGWQSFTPTFSGMLTGFQVYMYTYGSITYDVYQGEGTGGTLLYSTSVNYGIVGSENWKSVSFPYQTSLYLTSGEKYTISFSGATTYYSAQTSNPYPGGTLLGGSADLVASLWMSKPAYASFSQSSIAFGTSSVGTVKRDSVTITNAGCYTLTISSVSVINSQFTVTPTSASVAASGTQTFTITYTPSGATSVADSVTFVSDAPSGSTTKLPLSGTGLFQPQSGAGNNLTFNGTDQYVILPNNAALKVTTGTVEAWIKTSASNSAVFSKANEYSLMINGGNLGIYNWGPTSSNQGYQVSSTNVADGTWHHVAMSFQSGVTNGTILYVDGAPVYTTTLTRNANEADNIFAAVIGNAYSNMTNLPFPGSIDEVRLWSTVRTAQQLRENMHLSLAGNESGLLGYWRMDETSGTTTGDGTGNGYNGVYQNFPTRGNSDIPLGSGISSYASGTLTGVHGISNEFVITTSDPYDNSVDVVVTKINSAPNQLPSGSSTVLTDRYFIVHFFGNAGIFSAMPQIYVPTTFTNNGTASPANYTLYQRSSNSSGSWTAAQSGAYAVGTDYVIFSGISSYSQFTVGTNDPLPVELVSFKAEVRSQKSEVRLLWETATEKNSYGFEVERKQIPLPPSADSPFVKGETSEASGGFSKIGFVEGNGNSNSPKSYSFVDKNHSSGNYSYRLKQIDRDGKFTYSQTVEVTLNDAPKEFTLIQNYPNPFNPATSINYQLPLNGYVTLKVFDALGKEIVTLVNEVKEAGNYSVNFNAENLSSGLYFYQLTSGSFHQTRKMVLMK